mmetsp:Transcript_24317/g.37165  ORF Transcript_24317/g.37165 Transcript_24317/m.37165 type:complete len:91 (+) Transcript_24317:470-742(+)
MHSQLCNPPSIPLSLSLRRGLGERWCISSATGASPGDMVAATPLFITDRIGAYSPYHSPPPTIIGSPPSHGERMHPTACAQAMVGASSSW